MRFLRCSILAVVLAVGLAPAAHALSERGCMEITKLIMAHFNDIHANHPISNAMIGIQQACIDAAENAKVNGETPERTEDQQTSDDWIMKYIDQNKDALGFTSAEAFPPVLNEKRDALRLERQKLDVKKHATPETRSLYVNSGLTHVNTAAAMESLDRQKAQAKAQRKAARAQKREKKRMQQAAAQQNVIADASGRVFNNHGNAAGNQGNVAGNQGNVAGNQGNVAGGRVKLTEAQQLQGTF
jgi:hypothetical protein